MGRRIDKLKTIWRAFTTPIPVDEEWFQQRMEICHSCEYNSKNMDPEEFDIDDKLKVNICPDKQHCTACGCCLPEKPSQKTEVCGLIEIGRKPKWEAIEVSIPKDKSLVTENLTPEVGDLKKFGNEITYDLGESSDPKITFSIAMSRKGGFHIKSTASTCSCTVAEPIKISEDKYRFNVALSTLKFKAGLDYNRTFHVEYYSQAKKVEKAIIKIKLRKA